MVNFNSGNSGINTGNQRLVAEYTPVRAAGVRQEDRNDFTVKSLSRDLVALTIQGALRFRGVSLEERPAFSGT
jgi:hypothetical protein